MKTYSLAILLFAASLLAACGKEEPAPAPPKPRPAAKPQAAKPTDPTSKMARAFSAGKPTAPVELKYDVPVKPEPGKDLEIELAFIVSAVTDSMTVNVASATAGLEIVSGATASFGILKIDEIAKHKVVVRADRADVLYFTVTATLTAVGVNSSRAFSIPLIFLDQSVNSAPGAANATAEARAKPDATGQKIESMPAKESK